MYLQSQTSISIISNANFALFTPPGSTTPRPCKEISESLEGEILTGWQTGQCRDFINALAGSTRALAHGQIYPGPGNLADPQFGDYTQWQIENMARYKIPHAISNRNIGSRTTSSMIRATPRGLEDCSSFGPS